MELKHSTIDTKATREEILAEVARLKYIAADLKNLEQSLKLLLNGIYGALGNKWLVFFNPEIAETITLQGQDLIRFSERIINAYFNKFWHQDKELHVKLGITGEVHEVRGTVVKYADTDSNFLAFDEIARSCGWTADVKDLILGINEHRLVGYLTKQFEVYAAKWNTKNYMDFELENISVSGLWLAKKKYILDIVWNSEGETFPEGTNVKYSGVEIAQSSTPPFAREKLKVLIQHVLRKKRTLDRSEVVGMLREMKEEFKLANPDRVAQTRSINDYEKHVLNDVTGFEIAKGTPIHTRAAGTYNFMVNSNKSWKDKYQRIRSGDKCKYYYSKTTRKGEDEVFGYMPGSYPYEFAPPIDYDLQFTKTVIDPINRIIEAMGLPKILPGLQKITSAFDLGKEDDEIGSDDMNGFDPFAYGN